MQSEKCYQVCFNIGNVEVWSSNLYSNKKSALLETENSKDEIADQISCFSYDYTEENEKTFEMLEKAISQLKQSGTFREKKTNLDFFILEQPILEHYEQK